MRHRSEIDGLRAVAVVPVILFHAGLGGFGGGFVGVDVFFVISGFLITSIVLAELDANRFSITTFYERRARRILPALFAMMAVSLPLAAWLLPPSDLSSFARSLVSISGFSSNVFFWSERGYFGTATELKPLIHTWSLAVEEQYYVVFPLMLMALARARRSVMVGVLAACGLVSLGLCIWVTGRHVDTAFYLLPTRFWELLIGSLLAIWDVRHRKDHDLPAGAARVLEWVGLAMIAGSMFAFDSNTVFPGAAALLPTVGTALVIACAGEGTPLGRLLSWPLLVGIGLLSYSAYLWHQPLLAFARHYTGHEVTLATAAVVVALTFALAWLSWRYVETPFRDKRVWSRRGVFTFSGAGLAAFALAGAVGWLTQGMLFRYDEADQRLARSFIGGGAYTTARFDALRLAPFDPASPRRKVLVIGDSYAKDLVNAVGETALVAQVQMSTYRIDADCGNLWLDEDFSDQIDPKLRTRCRAAGGYDNPQLQALLAQADVVWLASSWSEWVAQRLPASIARIESTGVPVLVFGTKNFGEVAQRDLLSVPREQRVGHTLPIRGEQRRVLAMMAATIDPARYVDVSALLCGTGGRCPLFTQDASLMSYDGAHLTREGAAVLGRRLQAHPAVRAFLDGRPGCDHEGQAACTRLTRSIPRSPSASPRG